MVHALAAVLFALLMGMLRRRLQANTMHRSRFKRTLKLAIIIARRRRVRREPWSTVHELRFGEASVVLFRRFFFLVAH